MKHKPIKIISAFILWILSLFVIFYFTGKTADESNHTSMSIAQWLLMIFGISSPTSDQYEIMIEQLNHTIRKIGHFAEFALLGWTTWNLFRHFIKKKLAVVLASILFCLLIAASDEFRQQFVSGRGPQVADVVIDLMGSLFSMACILVVQRIALRNRISR